MKKAWSILMVLTALATMTCCAENKQNVSNADKPGGIVAAVVTEKATVDAINQDTRTMILKDEEGNSHFIKAGPEIRNFPQIRVGDEVIAQVSQSVVILVDKPDDKPAAPANQGGVVMLAPLGTKPGMVAANTMELTVTVVKINYDTRTVTLKSPEGKTITTKVDPSVKKFDNIKKGDQVYMQLTQEMAIRVETPKK